MFTKFPQTIIDELCLQYECDGLDRILIECYLNLNTAERQTIKKYIQSLADSLEANRKSLSKNVNK